MCSNAGKRQPVASAFISTEDDPLMLLIYTSGSTGTPKGAMRPERLGGDSWRRSNRARRRQHSAGPSIILSFAPMSHAMGRGSVYGTLGSGGTVYFVAKSDLSTFLDDLALVRPTQLNFVPRIWEMLFQEFHRELDRRSPDGAGNAGLDAQVLAKLRQNLLGGRFISASTAKYSAHR